MNELVWPKEPCGHLATWRMRLLDEDGHVQMTVCLGCLIVWAQKIGAPVEIDKP